MVLSAEDVDKLRKHIKDRVENYPDLDEMVMQGKLKYQRGWYEVTDKSSFDAIINYATSVRIAKNGLAQIKVSKLSKKLKKIADTI